MKVIFLLSILLSYHLLQTINHTSYITKGRNSIHRREKKLLAAPFLTGIPFKDYFSLLSSSNKWLIVMGDIGFIFFAIILFRTAAVKLLQSLRLFESFLVNYYNTEIYHIFIHCQTIPYPITLPNYTLSY